MIDKQVWRRSLRAARTCLSTVPGYRERAHRRMAELLMELAEAAPGSCVALYAAQGAEADPGLFAADWLECGGEVAYPRVVASGLMALFTCHPRQLVAGYRGILEPPDDALEVAAAELSMIVAPGLGFDPAGGRLGQGGGFYDRLLAARPAGCVAVGLGYACQVVAALPLEAHDQPVDLVVTEYGRLRSSGAASERPAT